MELSFPSLFACSFSLTVLTFILYAIMRKNRILSYSGIISIYLFTLLIIFRGCLPFDFYAIHLTTTYASTKVIPFIQQIMCTPVISYQSHTITILSILFYIWILVGVFLLLQKVIGYLFYWIKLKKLSMISFSETEAVYQASYRTIFPAKGPVCRIVTADNLASPAVFGILHPVILLPDISYTEEELHYVFLHELLHVKHKDFITKFVCDIVAAMHWWNPAVAILFPLLLRQVQELYVDYSISKTLTKEEKYPYLDCLKKSLVHTVNLQQKNQHTLYSLCDFSSEIKFKQRLFFIMKSNVKGISVFFILFTVVLQIASYSFVFEACHTPAFREDGGKIFYDSKDSSYFIRNGTEYDLYLNGEYVYTTPDIPSTFDNLPIYEDITS